MFTKKIYKIAFAALTMMAIWAVGANADSSVMLTVTIDPPDSGATVSGGGIDCPALCSKNIDPGNVSWIKLSIATVTNPNYLFDHWEINNTVAGRDPDTLIVNFVPVMPPLAVKAVFKSLLPTDSVRVWVSATEGGSVSGNGMNCPGSLCQKLYTRDTILTLTATPATGYAFAYWIIDDVNNGTSPSLSLSLSQSVFKLGLSKSVRAVFEPIGKNRITLSISPSDSGWITGEVLQSCINYPYQMDFAPAITPSITLTALENFGYDFDYWKVNDVVQTPSELSLTVFTSSPANVIAVFKPKTTVSSAYTLSVSVNPGGYNSVDINVVGQSPCYSWICQDCRMTFPAGTKLRLFATLSIGSKDRFLGWDGATASPDSLSEAYVTMDENKSVTANFQPIPISNPEQPVEQPATETSGGGCFIDSIVN